MLSAGVPRVRLEATLRPSHLLPWTESCLPAHAWQSVPDCQDKQVWPNQLAAAFVFSEIKKESELWAAAEINFWTLFSFESFLTYGKMARIVQRILSELFESKLLPWCPLIPKYFMGISYKQGHSSSLNHRTAVKIRSLMLIHHSLRVLGLHSSFTSCLNNVLCSKGSILLVLSLSVFYVFPILCNTWRIQRALAHSGLWKKKVLSLQMAGTNDGMVGMRAHSVLLTICFPLWLATLCEIIRCLCHLNSCTSVTKQSSSALWLNKGLKMSSLVKD